MRAGRAGGNRFSTLHFERSRTRTQDRFETAGADRSRDSNPTGRAVAFEAAFFTGSHIDPSGDVKCDSPFAPPMRLSL